MTAEVQVLPRSFFIRASLDFPGSQENEAFGLEHFPQFSCHIKTLKAASFS